MPDEVVRRIKRARRRGDSYRKIAAALDRDGVPTGQGAAIAVGEGRPKAGAAMSRKVPKVHKMVDDRGEIVLMAALGMNTPMDIWRMMGWVEKDPPERRMRAAGSGLGCATYTGLSPSPI